MGYILTEIIQVQFHCFDDATHAMSKEEDILVVQKILNSILMDYYVSNTSVSNSGRFPCYQKNFIEKFYNSELYTRRNQYSEKSK